MICFEMPTLYLNQNKHQLKETFIPSCFLERKLDCIINTKACGKKPCKLSAQRVQLKQITTGKKKKNFETIKCYITTKISGMLARQIVYI